MPDKEHIKKLSKPFWYSDLEKAASGALEHCVKNYAILRTFIIWHEEWRFVWNDSGVKMEKRG